MTASASEFTAHDGKREAVYLSAILAGPGGAGKSYSALLLASGLAGKGLVVVIDTEVKPITLYADEFKFKRIALVKPFTASRYRDAIRAAATLKPAVLIVDSATHEWMGSGGVLRQLDSWQENHARAPQFLFWKDATPQHDRFVDALTGQRFHVIVCCRGREKFVVESQLGDDGRKHLVPKSIGLRPLQRKDFRYDFMLSIVIDSDHKARPLTDTTKLFRDWESRPLTIEDGRALARWASTGAVARGGKK